MERLASSEELAAYVDVPLRTVYEWRYRGTGPKAIKVGRHLRYRWTDIEAWLKARETRGAVGR